VILTTLSHLVALLTMFSANVKQVLAVLCGVAVFNLTITPTNGFGIVLTLIGSIIYAYIDSNERRGFKE
jgi:hypothetical protein